MTVHRLSRIALLFVLFANTQGDLRAQLISAKLVEEFRLGDDENANEAYLFGTPSRVVVDSQNRFYVAEKRQNQIKVFDQTGLFLTRIGQRGRGPGEFQDLSGMVIDEQDRLVVIDRFTQRVTVFSNLGEELTTIPLPPDNFLEPWAFFRLRSHEFGVVAVPLGERGISPNNPNLISVYDTTFSRQISTFAPASDIYEDTEDPFTKSLIRRGGRVHVASNNQDLLWIATQYYDGIIHRYQYREDGWYHEEWQGTSYDESAYEAYRAETAGELESLMEEKNVSSVMNGVNGRFVVVVRRYSLGLFCLNDDKIVNFVFTRKDSEQTIGVEIFQPDGQFMGYAPVEFRHLEGSRSGSSRAPSIIGMDHDDRFYMVDYGSGPPVIRVMRLEYEMAEDSD